MSMHVNTDTLPQIVKDALKSVKYGRKDIRVEHVDMTDLSVSGGDGSKGFVILVDLGTSRYETIWGSWGGANMFNPDNPVDLDRNAYNIPIGAIVIRGTISANPTWATIYANKNSSVLPLTKGVELDKDTRNALYCYKSIKGGQYRADELNRRNVTKATIETCVADGWIKVNKAGSGQITTEGKNVLGSYNGYGS